MIIISLTRFNLGGFDILDIDSINHHIYMEGDTIIKPFIIINDRTLICS